MAQLSPDFPARQTSPLTKNSNPSSQIQSCSSSSPRSGGSAVPRLFLCWLPGAECVHSLFTWILPCVKLSPWLQMELRDACAACFFQQALELEPWAGI